MSNALRGAGCWVVRCVPNLMLMATLSASAREGISPVAPSWGSHNPFHNYLRPGVPPHPPFARATVKALKMTEPTPPTVLTRALFAYTMKRRKQRHYLSARSMHDNLQGGGNQTCGNEQQDSHQHPCNTITGPKS